MAAALTFALLLWAALLAMLLLIGGVSLIRSPASRNNPVGYYSFNINMLRKMTAPARSPMQERPEQRRVDRAVIDVEVYLEVYLAITRPVAKRMKAE